MKKVIMMLVLTVGFVTTISAQTKQEKAEKSKHEHVNKANYACPMKCEGDKTYTEAGKCPKCGMDLTKNEVKEKTASKKSCCKYKGDKKGHPCNMEKKDSDKQSSTYQCPMKCEGDKTYAKAGDCPKCGMDLQPTKTDKK